MLFKGNGGLRGFRAQTFFAPDVAPGGDPPPPADPSAADPPGDNEGGDDEGALKAKYKRIFGRQLSSERKRADEAEARIREIEEQRAAAEEEERKKRGEFEQLYTDSQSRLKQLEEENATFKAREQERIERMTAKNDERLKALPEKYHGRPIHPDPEEQAALLAEYEKEVAETRPGAPGVFGEPARPPSGGAPPSKADRIAEMRARAADVQLGRVKTEARGVTR